MNANRSVVFALFLSMLLFISCKDKDDTCGGFECQNDGTCIDNSCYCPFGYIGSFCENELAPSSIRITNIKLLQYPVSNASGVNVDHNNRPDIYVVLYHGENTVYVHPTHYSEPDPEETHDFKPAVNLNLIHPTDNYQLALYDKDDDADDLIGEVTFTPYQQGFSFPETFQIDFQEKLTFELTVQYSF